MVATLMSIYLGFGLLAILFVLIFLDKIKILRGNERRGVCDLFIATLKHLKNKKMQLLIPLTIFSGLEQGFVFGDFTKVSESSRESLRRKKLIEENFMTKIIF